MSDDTRCRGRGKEDELQKDTKKSKYFALSCGLRNTSACDRITLWPETPSRSPQLPHTHRAQGLSNLHTHTHSSAHAHTHAHAHTRDCLCSKQPSRKQGRGHTNTNTHAHAHVLLILQFCGKVFFFFDAVHRV